MQCYMYLGEVTSSESKKPEVNLKAAQESIDLLVMLKEKTKGNLDPQEEQLLNQLTADLQMKFVQRPAT